ncbi:MAG: amidase [Acidobacteriota bacterium]|nr:amidase [Acidobacteriota bacterium]
MTRREALALALGPWALRGVNLVQATAQGFAGAPQGRSPGITSLSLTGLALRIRQRDLSPTEVVEAYLERIERLNPDLNAYVTVTADNARARARELTAEFARGRGDSGARALLGVPLAHKDLFDTAGVRTTGGSKLYADRIPSRDAEVVARLHAAGAVTLGKTNTHELGGGVTTINPFYGTTRNPRDRARVPGGSSGGSATAVAAELAAAATGSDTGGSIRIPAAFCGCVGFKPSFGIIGTAGLLGACPTFDHAGFLARTIGDLEVLLDTTLVGDATGRPTNSASRAAEGGTRTGVRGLRVGVPRRYFFDELDAEVAQAVEAALSRLRTEGADVRDVEVPVDDTTMARVFDPIVVSEIRATYQEAWRTSPDAFSPEFAAIFAAPLPSTEELAAAHRARRQFESEMAAALRTVDVLSMPAVPVTAPRIEGPIDGARILRNAWPFNAARTPALSLPCGEAAALPVGLQIVGPFRGDRALLRAAAAIHAIVG